MVSTMRDNLGLPHGEAEDVSTWPDLMAEGFTQHDSLGENPNNEGNKKDHPGDQKFNCKVPSGYDTKIGPHTGSDVAQVTKEYHPPDADYWEEIMPQFDLDDAVAEGDLLVEEIACNMIEA